MKAARSLGRRARRSLARRAGDWPERSPGSLNAWLLLATTKPPAWEDTFVRWDEQPLAVGTPHHGFFYPDPLGFWTEVRRWTNVLFGRVEPSWTSTEALSLTALLHLGDDTPRLDRALSLMRPRLVLFLDEPAWQSTTLEVHRRDVHHILDPHRPGQVYEGFWGVSREGIVVGKAPQHPAAHKLYDSDELTEYLLSAPVT